MYPAIISGLELKIAPVTGSSENRVNFEFL